MRVAAVRCERYRACSVVRIRSSAQLRGRCLYEGSFIQYVSPTCIGSTLHGWKAILRGRTLSSICWVLLARHATEECSNQDIDIRTLNYEVEHAAAGRSGTHDR